MSRFCICFLLLTQNLFATIITIEGMPGAGKTTHLFQLARDLEGRSIIISEMNPEPGATWTEKSSAEQNAIFHELWVERMQLLQQFPKETVFLLDRSYISNLAFAYALDSLQGSSIYADRKDRALRDITFHEDLIIVLDATPKTSLERRIQSGELIPWPWAEPSFLNKFQEFYHKELKDYSVVYIETEGRSKEEVYSQVIQALQPYLPKDPSSRQSFSQHDEKLILDFAEKMGLGEAHSELVSVLQFPTIYFSKHSVQLDDDGNQVFFNNARIKTLCEKLQS